ncbi:MAG TPA: asparaginase [Candidatus Limnocylindrales bacterium]|nr:asparaginase [Candidatus Limnocylindrales bacterium]
MRRVAIVFTGGTISSEASASAGGNIPTLDGAAIVARTPGLESIAAIDIVDRGRTPASHFTFPDLFAIADAIREVLARPDVDGCVVVQGTDTIEETSFFWDLVVDDPKPVVVTGAMRAASDEGYDGPRNLSDAVRVAASASARGAGTVVVMNGEIGAADRATKLRSTGLDAFATLDLGTVDGDDVRIRGRDRRRSVATTRAADRVHLITAHVAMDGSLVDAAVASGADGIVVAGTGSGNTSVPLLDACRAAIDAGIPVVLASRCGLGGAVPAYAFPGGGVTWVRAGALSAGELSAPKARVALALGIGAGLDRPALTALLAGALPT